MGLTGDQILREINDAQSHAMIDPFRAYLGMSTLGHECARAIWYNWRWFKPEQFSPRMLRLFDRGHREEERFVDALRLIGFKVEEVDPLTGNQFEYKAWFDHLQGHSDGKAFRYRQSFLLEMKTHNQNSFVSVRKGKIEMTKKGHYCQAQRYMEASGIEEAIYCAVNKNDDALHFEVFGKDKVTQAWLLERERMLIEATKAPDRISSTSSHWICRMCNYQGVCFFGEKAFPSCRSCKESELEPGCNWSCSKRERKGMLSLSVQKLGCPAHRPY